MTGSALKYLTSIAKKCQSLLRRTKLPSPSRILCLQRGSGTDPTPHRLFKSHVMKTILRRCPHLCQRSRLAQEVASAGHPNVPYLLKKREINARALLTYAPVTPPAIMAVYGAANNSASINRTILSSSTAMSRNQRSTRTQAGIRQL